MNLFNKEKDLILRIMNLILIVWLIVALILTFAATYNLIDYESKMSYQTFKDGGCTEWYSFRNEEERELTETECRANYVRYERNYEQTRRSRRLFLTISITQVILVGGTLFIINRKKKEKSIKF